MYVSKVNTEKTLICMSSFLCVCLQNQPQWTPYIAFYTFVVRNVWFWNVKGKMITPKAITMWDINGKYSWATFQKSRNRIFSEMCNKPSFGPVKMDFNQLNAHKELYRPRESFSQSEKCQWRRWRGSPMNQAFFPKWQGKSPWTEQAPNPGLGSSHSSNGVPVPQTARAEAWKCRPLSRSSLGKGWYWPHTLGGISLILWNILSSAPRPECGRDADREESSYRILVLHSLCVGRVPRAESPQRRYHWPLN